VITTKGTPWCELEEYGCGWWIELGGGELENALKVATGTGGEVLREMGGKGRQLIDEKYSWNQVAARTIELYRGILSGHGG
jgi:glycosyltransferase involved in cell wall biosynthesis